MQEKTGGEGTVVFELNGQDEGRIDHTKPRSVIG